MLKTADPRRKAFVKGSTMHPLLKKEDQNSRRRLVQCRYNLVTNHKGYKVAGKVVFWPKDGQLSSAEFIRIRERGLNKVTNNYAHALAHSTHNPSELWHKRFGHLHFKALPGLQSMMSSMPPISSNKDEVCKGYTKKFFFTQ